MKFKLFTNPSLAGHTAIALATGLLTVDASALAVASSSFSAISFSARDLNPNDSIAPSFRMVESYNSTQTLWSDAFSLETLEAAGASNVISAVSSLTQVAAASSVSQNFLAGRGALVGYSSAYWQVILEISPGAAVDISFDEKLYASTSLAWPNLDQAVAGEYAYVSNKFVVYTGNIVYGGFSGYEIFNRRNIADSLFATGAWSVRHQEKVSTSVSNNGFAPTYALFTLDTTALVATNASTQAIPVSSTLSLSLMGFAALLFSGRRQRRLLS